MLLTNYTVFEQQTENTVSMGRQTNTTVMFDQPTNKSNHKHVTTIINRPELFFHKN